MLDLTLVCRESCCVVRPRSTQGIAWGSLAGGAVVGWLAGGKFHSGRLQKKLNAKHKEDQKALYKQYYNDVVR
jgi:hypothetical protein